ncbi:MAG: hypothetical protein ACYC4D_03860 [Thermoleophilia bacterium]
MFDLQRNGIPWKVFDYNYKNLMVESDTGNFVLFRTGGAVKPLDRISFLSQAETILNLLVKQAQQQKQ